MRPLPMPISGHYLQSDMTSLNAYSVPLPVATLPANGDVRRFEADGDARKRIADAYDLAGIERFVIDVRLTPDGKGGVTAVGAVDADIIYTCVVSLDPFPARIREPFDMRFVAPRLRQAKDKIAEIDFSADDEDPPEEIENGLIDPAALALEFFGLALDPYPRKPGVAFEEPEPEEKPVSPFAALAKLKDKS
jgi:uncharacterized metal-binding protein YceD (DUF177 family)